MREVKKLLLTLLIVALLLGGFLLYLSWPLLTGRSLVLATQPIDPFDFFRGQYLTINYEISQIPALEGVNVSDVVYVTMQNDETGIWRYVSASTSRPSTPVFLRGVVRSISGGTLRAEYGIEQYFFEQGAQLPRTNITVEVKADSSGQARIVRLLHDGKPLNITYRNVTLTS